MQIIVNKLLTTYNEIGNGSKTIVFLHGWADAGNTFEMLARELIALNKDYKCVLVDLPGFGSTATPDDAWNLADYSAFVASFLQKANIRPYALIGHSNGGAIALNALAHGIVSTSKLILVASAGIRDKSVKKDAMRLLAKPAKVAIKIAPKQVQKRIKQKLYSTVGSDYLVAEHMQETFKLVVGYDVRKEAAGLTIPTCLIYGSTDTSTPPVYGQLLADIIPSSEFHEIPSAGHFVHQEQAFKVARIAVDFIDDRQKS